MKTLTTRLLVLLALLLAPIASAQELDWKKLLEKGDYKGLAEKLRPYLELEKSDPKLRKYLEMNLEYLARGGASAQPGNEIILVRGIKNDVLFKMPPASGGSGLLVPNSIRYMRTSWDKRLPRLDGYFREATTLLGGNGDQLRELDKIISHHKGGGLGKGSNSVKSVLISASTVPLSTFGPPFVILKVAPERAIFNYNGLSGEKEVLLPFWVLPKEIVAVCNSMEEVKNHPAFQESKLKNLEFSSSGYGAGGAKNNWQVIEENIRAGRPPLEGVAGLNSYFREGLKVGPEAPPEYVTRFIEKVRANGGSVEYVAASDPRLPAGVQARTYLGPDGRPKVLLRRGETPRKFALLDELTHVLQLARMLRARGAAEVETLLLRAETGDPAARDAILRWELKGKTLLRSMLAANDPDRATLERSIAELERELDPHRAARRADGTLDWSKVKSTAARATGTAAASVVHFGLALFLKELAVVARTGDRLRIEEFFQGLTTTDFYVEFGLFSVGAMAGDAAYAAFLKRHLDRFVKPRFVQQVLRSQVALAVGMALPDLVHGRFDGRTFALNVAGLGLSSTAVKAGVAALTWVVDLKRVPAGARVLERLGRMGRLTSVTGFVYTAAETAVVLYFGERITQELDAALARRTAKAEVEAATTALLAALRGEGDARAALDRLSVANQAYRDVLTRPLQEVEARLWDRLNRAGVMVKQADDSLRRYRELAAEDPARYGALLAAAERLAARREGEGRAEVERIFAAYDAESSAVAREVYGPAGPATPVEAPDAALAWALRGGQVGGEGDPWGTRADIFARFGRSSVLGRAADEAAALPGTRLAAYDAEARFLERLAAAHTDDPEARDVLLERARAVREVRDLDRAVVLREGPALGRRPTAGTAAPADETVRGFIDALNER